MSPVFSDSGGFFDYVGHVERSSTLIALSSPWQVEAERLDRVYVLGPAGTTGWLYALNIERL